MTFDFLLFFPSLGIGFQFLVNVTEIDNNLNAGFANWLIGAVIFILTVRAIDEQKHFYHGVFYNGFLSLTQFYVR